MFTNLPNLRSCWGKLFDSIDIICDRTYFLKVDYLCLLENQKICKLWGSFSGMPQKKDSSMFKQLLQKVESIDTSTSLTEQIMVAKSSDEVKVLLKFTPDDNYAMQKRLIILEFVASWCGLCDQVLKLVYLKNSVFFWHSSSGIFLRLHRNKVFNNAGRICQINIVFFK